MRQAAVILTMILALAVAAFGETESAAAERLDFWKTVNFLILAAILGWAAYKFGGPFLNARTREIRQGIDEAAKIKKDAETRFAEIDARLSSLSAQVEELRKQAHQESAAEADRMRQETGRQRDRIFAQAGREIEAVEKATRKELRAYAAGLAIDLAARRLREQMTPETDQALVQTMLRDLEHRAQAESARVS